MPMLDAIGAYLESQGIGTVKTAGNTPTAWPIYKGGAQATHATIPGIVYISEGPGSAPTDTMGATPGSVVAENPSLVLQCRHADYSVARAKAESAWTVLHKKGNATLSGVRYLLIRARQSPFPTGRDEWGRWVIGCNYDIAKERG